MLFVIRKVKPESRQNDWHSRNDELLPEKCTLPPHISRNEAVCTKIRYEACPARSGQLASLQPRKNRQELQNLIPELNECD